MRHVFLALATAALLAVSGCKQPVRGGEPNQTELYVLVDLSETWFNPQSAEKNTRLLTAVGHGAGLAAPAVKPPYLVQYRVIGTNSYMREPICSGVYMPGLRHDKIDDERVSRPQQLAALLTGTCVQLTMQHPPEDQTQISAAIASVAEEPKPTATTKRYIVILSDFLEETASKAPIADGALSGVTVLLLYRPLTADQQHPVDTTERVDAWRDLLAAKGATVKVAPDTDARASEIVSMFNP